ncbi:MAG: hypothetical protein RLZZ234_13 [Candidatus Parcubacteria bacterium]|jgi:hypothetical protein
MKSITPRTLIFAALATTAFSISCAVYVGAAYYVNTLEGRLYETKVNTKRAEDERRQLDALKKLVADTQDERARLASYIVEDQAVINFLAEVEGIATARGVKPETRTIATAPIESATLFEDLVVTMNLSGKLTEVKPVIQRIEQLPYQLRIEQGSLQSIDTNSASADIIIIATKKKP